MLRRTAKAILILGAIASIPRDSEAGRVWFWGFGPLRPDMVQDQRAPEPKPAYGPGARLSRAGPPLEEQEPVLGRRQADLEKQQAAEKQRREIERQRADLRRQQAELQKREAQFATRQAVFKREQAKFRQQTAALGSTVQSSTLQNATIQNPTVQKKSPCDAAAAIVTDFGFQDVKPELCTGTTSRFSATRGATKFVVEVAPNGELTKVHRLP
jgi:DNA-binding transcriptional MerR regulator